MTHEPPAVGVIPPPLRLGDGQIWWADLRSGPITLDLLDDEELARWAEFGAEGPRDRFALSRRLSRLVVAAHVGLAPTQVRLSRTCLHCGGPHGKPRVLGPGRRLQMSVSHSGNHVVVAVAWDVPLGVDVETMLAPGESFPSVALSPPERAVIATLPFRDQAAAFARYWCRKEALLKATGWGLLVAPDLVTLSAPDEAPRLLRWGAEQRRPDLASLVDLTAPPGCVASLAALGAPLRLSDHDGHRLLGYLG